MLGRQRRPRIARRVEPGKTTLDQPDRRVRIAGIARSEALVDQRPAHRVGLAGQPVERQGAVESPHRLGELPAIHAQAGHTLQHEGLFQRIRRPLAQQLGGGREVALRAAEIAADAAGVATGREGPRPEVVDQPARAGRLAQRLGQGDAELGQLERRRRIFEAGLESALQHQLGQWPAAEPPAVAGQHQLADRWMALQLLEQGRGGGALRRQRLGLLPQPAERPVEAALERRFRSRRRRPVGGGGAAALRTTGQQMTDDAAHPLARQGAAEELLELARAGVRLRHR